MSSAESWFEVRLVGLGDAVEDAALVDQAATALADLQALLERAEEHPELVESMPPSHRRFLAAWFDDQIETLGFLLEVRR
jgi:hypothetical protein